jgi:signal transduction histidine kinase
MKVARSLTLLLGLVALVVMTGLTLVLIGAGLSYLGDDMENDHRTIVGVIDAAIVDQWQREEYAASAAMLARIKQTGLQVELSGEEGLAQLSEAQRAQLRTTGFVSFERGGFRHSWSKVPVQVPTWLELRESISSHFQWVRGLLVTVLISAVALLATFLAVALVTGRRLIGEPVQRLVAFAQRVGEGDFSARSTVTSRNELGELGRHLDSMAGALLSARERVHLEEAQKHAAEERLHHAERLTTVGKLAAGIAHELGTPLSVVSTWSRMISSGEASGDEAKRGAQIIAQESSAMAHIIRQLLDFARRRLPQRGELDANTLLETTVTLVGTLASQLDVPLVHKDGPPCLVSVDPMQLQQVLTNLVMNAVQATKGRKGKVELRVDKEQREAPADVEPRSAQRQWVVIHVTDQGAGMAPEVMNRVFEPFFTTKDVGEGSGLGLSVSWSIVRDHGGWIQVASEIGVGSDFAVYLPG